MSSFYWELYISPKVMAINKADFKWQRHGAILWRRGGKFDLFYYRRTSIGADLNDLTSSDMIFDPLGREGTLRLHFPAKKFPIRYLAGPRALVILAKIRNGI